MSTEFFILQDGALVNTFDGRTMEPQSECAHRYQRKYNINFFHYPIDNGCFYQYDVENNNGSISLIVYEVCFKNKKKKYQEVYRISCTPNKTVCIDDEFDFWYEMFATNYGNSNYSEFNVNLFSVNGDAMKIVREVFTTDLSHNVFMFFKKRSKLRKINDISYQKQIFNGIKYPNVNKHVGKALNNTKGDNADRHYAWQREINIDGVWFLDVIYMSGKVTDGIIYPSKQNRFFITDGFVYSPDGGDLTDLVMFKIEGKQYFAKFSKAFPRAYIDRYSGVFPYAYILSKDFVPAFEFLAKAGKDYSVYADATLNSYFKCLEDFNASKVKGCSYMTNTNGINYFGKNPQEVFGFKMKDFLHVPQDEFKSILSNNQRSSEYSHIISVIKNINKYNPGAFEEIIDRNSYTFAASLYRHKNLKNLLKYLKQIGTENAITYRDYIFMSERTHVGPGLYPKNLKAAHDTQNAYMSQMRQAKEFMNFKEMVDSTDYTRYAYSPQGEEYVIIAPEKAEDLVSESYALSHCVQSYISRVSFGYTRIYFLRDADRINKPLVTIEVSRGSIIQVRGKANRSPVAKERVFIEKWAKEKNLLLKYSDF